MRSVSIWNAFTVTLSAAALVRVHLKLSGFQAFSMGSHWKAVAY
jgi:hypothetical protein